MEERIRSKTRRFTQVSQDLGQVLVGGTWVGAEWSVASRHCLHGVGGQVGTRMASVLVFCEGSFWYKLSEGHVL